jgi:uncharacterized protein (DUF1697 family)
MGTPKTSDFHVALLRGVNVGGKNSLPMKELAKMFVDAGCDDVRTYIQSGNVVFRAKRALAQRVPSLVSAAIVKRFGFESPVLTRTAEELRVIAAKNPFLRKGADSDRLHVAFLASLPTSTKDLDPKRSPPDEFVLQGREIFLHLPNGVGKTKLTNAYFDSKLRTTSTVRNWRTVLTLLDLASGAVPAVHSGPRDDLKSIS